MPKSKRNKRMTRNIPRNNPQGTSAVPGTQPISATNTAGGQTMSTVSTRPVTPSFRGSQSSKQVTLPVITYVGQELKSIGILTGIIVVIIVVLTFVMR